MSVARGSYLPFNINQELFRLWVRAFAHWLLNGNAVPLLSR
jgi:hypothetical protein